MEEEIQTNLEEETPIEVTPEEKTKENQDAGKDLETALAQKAHWREKAEKLQAQIDALKPKEEPKKQPEDDLSIVKKVKLLSGLSEEQISFVSNYARGTGKSLEDTLQDQSVKIAIEAMDKKMQEEKKVPEPNYGGATFNQKPISELSSQEIKDNWEAVRDAAIKEGRARNKK
jgi:hypothetical protein